jgi:hypothetical protein
MLFYCGNPERLFIDTFDHDKVFDPFVDKNYPLEPQDDAIWDNYDGTEVSYE